MLVCRCPQWESGFPLSARRSKGGGSRSAFSITYEGFPQPLGWNGNCTEVQCWIRAPSPAAPGISQTGASFIADLSQDGSSSCMQQPQHRVIDPKSTRNSTSTGERMPETVMDQIVSVLKRDGGRYYPQRGELRNVRVVGHTPKNDHYIYD